MYDLRIAVAVLYCIIWNLTDFPAGVVQFGTESCSRIDQFDDEGDMFLRLAKKVKLNLSIGLPGTNSLISCSEYSGFQEYANWRPNCGSTIQRRISTPGNGGIGRSSKNLNRFFLVILKECTCFY